MVVWLVALVAVGGILLVGRGDGTPWFPAPEVPRIQHAVFVKTRAETVAITRARRAIVYIGARYSVPAGLNRDVFLRALGDVAQRDPSINCDSFWINDYEWYPEWLNYLDEPQLSDIGWPGRHGLVLWMESGRVVRLLSCSELQETAPMVETTLRLWGRGR
jgi:hypothetical protein